ncbi:MAG: alpha/beta fold hydrolase [Candidatus Sericytochromatia bacterium]|nr:alpha/beta fold hydrolase [Candidatus Tanganyikabacteria bacterium]
MFSRVWSEGGRSRAAGLAGLVLAAAGLATGCGPRGLAGPDGTAQAFDIQRSHASAIDVASDFSNAVYDRLAGGTAGIGPELGLPPETFRALDADGNGRVSRGEWNRQIPATDAARFEAAYRPFAAATFKLAGAGAARLAYEDLEKSLGQHPNRPENLTPRAFREIAPSGALDLQGFEAYYPKLGGQSLATKGLGNLLMGPYLKFAGFVGSEFLMRRPRKPVKTNPGSLGLKFDEATLQTEDGLAIKAWYIPAAAPSTKAVVMVHGHGSNRATWVENPVEFKAIRGAGYNVVMLDLRRHGESGGEWITMALHEDNDVRAGVRWAASRGNTAIGLLGNSLGGASIIHTAATTPGVKAVWDDCAFASVADAVRSATGMLNLPHADLVVPAILETGSRRLGEDLAASQPRAWIARFAGRPVSIVHGAADKYIVAGNSFTNFEAARDPKTLWIVPNAGHGNSSSTAPAEYQQRLTAFLEKNVGRNPLPAFAL